MLLIAIFIGEKIMVECIHSCLNVLRVFAKNAGCPEDLGKIKDCLKSKKMMDIVKASLRTPFPSFIPVIDGNFLEG